MINLKDRNAILRYHRWVIKQWDKLESRYSKLIQNILVEQYEEVAEYMLHGLGLESIEESLRINTRQLEKTFYSMYEETTRIFHTETLSAVKFILPKEYKASEERYYYNMNKWIKKQTAKLVVGVNRTTKSNIRSLIERGMNEGMSNNEIANDILELKEIATKYRAITIARTETHTASMNAEVTTLKEEGLHGVLKKWSATLDDRTRLPHLEADAYYSNNPIPVEEPFIVNGEALMYPGDPNGSAGNVIRCRCVILYETKDVY